MSIVGYYKSDPTEYVLVYTQGQVRRQGAGIAFFYFKPSTTIVSLSVSTVDVPFILNEMTGNFQTLTVQGQLTYRIANPALAAASLNFAIQPRTRKYTSKDPEKLDQRIVNALQTHLRPELSRRPLDQALRDASEMARSVLARLQADETLAALGVECHNLCFLAVKPAPDMAKALEAEYREGLQQRADQAIYARRAAAVEQERTIKENELRTQMLLEQKRQELVDLQGGNTIREAEYQAQAEELELQPWRSTDPRTLIGLAFRKIGENAGGIQNLSITPELLTSLIR